jgi:peptidoglycan/LPS O-acetylase OafA/YrhL
LIVYCGKLHTLVTRLLSLPPVRLIGKASYSIYLWHWPLIVFCKYCFVATEDERGAGATTLIIIAAIFLGLASWKFVELPFRKKTARSHASRQVGPLDSERSRKGILSIASIAAAMPVLAGMLILALHGLPGVFHKMSSMPSARKMSAKELAQVV